MKSKKPIARKPKRRNGAGLLLIIVAALTLEGISLIEQYFTRMGLREEAQMRAESQMEASRLMMLDVAHQAEAAVRNSIWIASWCLDYPDSLPRVAQRIVEDNPMVMGSTLALVPNYSRRRPLYAPYACRQADTLVMKSLATEEYDYPSQEWFTKPLEIDEGYWAEPYVDFGGGDILMTTYSVPIHDSKGTAAAVLTADISLAWLSQLFENSPNIYPDSYQILMSRNGQMAVNSNNAAIEGGRLSQLTIPQSDRDAFESLGATMLAENSGNVPVTIGDEPYQAFFSRMDRTGWAMAIVIPEDEIYGSSRQMTLLVRLLQLLGLGMLVLILRGAAKNQLKYQAITEKKDRMENELQIGRNIQMSMIPNTFPPFPERNDIDLSACLVPAKEVGGDLYDFYINDNRLFFCIGDVSGKGVPASLVMAVTRSLFRTVSAHEKSPQRIVTTMNESMSDMNDNNMFVTFFCGILDLETGHLRFCNAGHNPPLLLSKLVRTLEVEPNVPLGIIKKASFREQETDLKYDDTLFLYTDGLNEAENKDFEQFSLDRMKKVLKEHRDAKGQLDAMQEAVDAFVAGAPQSDDLTMLIIHYLNDTDTVSSERHLILHNDIQQIPQLAEFVEIIADEKGLDQSMAMSLNLAHEEAVTNVIEYAYPEGSDGLVDIEAILRKDRLDFIITDSGIPFDPTTERPEVDINAGVEERPIGGLGIYLVRQIMDSVKYRREDGKNILTMIKNV